MSFIYIIFICALFNKLEAVQVYTDSTYPRISVTDSSDYYTVTINDLEGDSLYDVAYTWGTKPYVYAAVCVAYDDTTNWYFSVNESLRWEYIQKRTVERWDQATYNKHPLIFYFVKSPLLIEYTKDQLSQDGFGILNLYSGFRDKFQIEYPETLNNPHINISVDGGQYINDVGQSSGSDGDQRLSSIYIGMFKKGSEVIDAVIVHELCHPFVYLPNISPWFDENSHYIQIGDNDVEKYDPLSLTEPPLDNFYCASLSQMCLGIRSKYEDAGLWMYNIHTGDSSYIDTVSSKYFYEQRDEGTVYTLMKRYWNLHWNSPKISLPDSTWEFLIPKSEQDNRSLLVFASDSLHPGYFKCFSLGAKSEATVIENEVPNGISLSRHYNINPATIKLGPNPFTYNLYISLGSYNKSTIIIYDSDGTLIKVITTQNHKLVWDGKNQAGNKVKAGIYFININTGADAFSKSILKIR